MAADTKIRIRHAVLPGSPSPSQTPLSRGERSRLQSRGHAPLARPDDERIQQRMTGFLIHGSAIKINANLPVFSDLPNSNRRLEGGLTNHKIQPVSDQRTQHALRKLKLDAQNPVEMKFLGREPFLELFPRRRFELRHHLAFLHVHHHAFRRPRSRRRDPLPQFLRALPRQASKRVLRDVTSHWISSQNNLDARNSKQRYQTGSSQVVRFVPRIKSSRFGSARIKTGANRISSDTLCREKKQMPEPRAAHPYYLYDAIHAQPALIEKVIARRDAIERAADAMAEKERIAFVGIGTSLHAAQIAELWMREFTAGRIWPHFEQSFELVNHPIAFGPRDAVVVITHTGTTTASIAALRAARAAGALTIAITGQPAGTPFGAEIRSADFHIETCDQEVSFAYTKSYTAALAALALMILRIAERKKLLASGIDASVIERIPEFIKEALTLEPQIREVAKKIAPLSRIVLFGAGAGWLTAREGALKIKESCYIAAEGFETEEVLHGPFSEIDSRAALIGLLTGRPSDDRARQILRAAGELKTQRLAIVTPSANHEISAEHSLIVPEASPETGEWLPAFPHPVPLHT